MPTCPICGTENPAGFRFCGQCGTALLEEMRAAVEQHSGVVEKFIGDAVMAVFGVPVAHEDDALRAVRAATDMLARLDELNDEFEGRFGSRIGLRIGINTGEV